MKRSVVIQWCVLLTWGCLSLTSVVFLLWSNPVNIHRLETQPLLTTSPKPLTTSAKPLTTSPKPLTTLPKLLTVTKKPRLVLITTNNAFLDFTQNLLMSIERTGARPHVVVIAEDEESYKELSLFRHKGLQVLQPNTIGVPIDNKNNKTLKFASGDYNKFVNRRPTYILEFVQRGYEVFFMDVDSFWFRDPFPYLEGDFDIAYYNDRFNMYNAGVAFYRPTNRTLRFLKHFVWTLKTQKKVLPDQNVMNDIIRSQYIPDLHIKHLNNENFPNGGFMFPFFPNMVKCREDTATTVVFHAAWISGHKKKKEAMQTCHIWLVSQKGGVNTT